MVVHGVSNIELNHFRDGASCTMTMQDRSSFFLRDFEPSAVRLKRKLRLILNKNLRQEKLTDKHVTLTEFVFYTSNAFRTAIYLVDVHRSSVPCYCHCDLFD
jgi:hypothetical protein